MLSAPIKHSRWTPTGNAFFIAWNRLYGGALGSLRDLGEAAMNPSEASGEIKRPPLTGALSKGAPTGTLLPEWDSLMVPLSM